MTNKDYSKIYKPEESIKIIKKDSTVEEFANLY